VRYEPTFLGQSLASVFFALVLWPGLANFTFE
jgi:hypothetical protein